MSLLSPVLLVDQETREAVADQPDPRGHLRPEGTVFVGQLPPDIPIANTALDWAGMRWVMVMRQSLPDALRAAVRLLAHEAFHCVREQLGLPWPETTGISAHLDDLEGPYWLQFDDLRVPPGNRLTHSGVIEKVSTRSPSTTHGASVSGLLRAMLTMLRLRTITEGGDP